MGFLPAFLYHIYPSGARRQSARAFLHLNKSFHTVKSL